jgi:hypothetical protein
VAIFELFSMRETRKRGEVDDVLKYDELPDAFRGQVIHIALAAIGVWQDDGFGPISHPTNDIWKSILQIYCREKGTFELSPRARNPFEQCANIIMKSPVMDALDLIDIMFVVINTRIGSMRRDEREYYRFRDPKEAIDELNQRFGKHNLGYEFIPPYLIRVDSKHLHAEAVKPALTLLHGAGPQFAGPLQEFIDAHIKYKNGKTKDAINDALKAFESTMKAICTAHGWPFDQHKDTAKDLLQIVFDHELVPTWLQGQFTALRSVLESGLPTVRNKKSGHGQGTTPTEVPAYLVRYALNLMATNIVFLIEAHKAK